MRASIKLNFVIVTSLLMGSAFASAASKAASAVKPPIAKPAVIVEKPEENALNSAIVQKLLSSIKGSACGFELELEGWLDLSGNSAADSKSPLKYLDVDCTVQLSDKNDLNFSLLKSEKEKNQGGFDTVVNFKSKGLTLHLYGQKINGASALSVRFYSGFDTVRNAWTPKPLEVTVSVLNGKEVISSELIAVRLSAIDLKAQENPQNPAELMAAGSCKAEQKSFDIRTARNEFKPSVCTLEGTYEPKKGLKYNFKFKNASAMKATLP